LPDNFGLQLSVKFGPNGDMVNVRGEDGDEFGRNLEAVRDYIGEMRDLGAALRMTTDDAVANVQAAMPGAQPIGEIFSPPQAGTGAFTPPPPAIPVSAPAAAAQCPACSRSTACPDCGGITSLGVKQSTKKGQGYNAHICAQNDRHKVVWCKTPFPTALAPAIGSPPGLIYG
jgi:hypothetical protein